MKEILKCSANHNTYCTSHVGFNKYCHKPFYSWVYRTPLVSLTMFRWVFLVRWCLSLSDDQRINHGVLVGFSLAGAKMLHGEPFGLNCLRSRRGSNIQYSMNTAAQVLHRKPRRLLAACFISWLFGGSCSPSGGLPLHEGPVGTTFLFTSWSC